MPKSRIPSPARSQGGIITPRRNKPRGSRSVCSPALSTASGRLTSVIDQFREKNLDSFALSPLNNKSVLTDNTDIEEPRRKSWWKNLNENSRDVMELLQDDKVIEANNAIEDIVDIEVLSQEKKNYTLDLPESSDNESINSIVLPQRRLFTQKENQPQRKFGQLVGTRETLAKLHKSGNNTQGDKTIAAGTRDLFQGTKRTKPIFPAALLNISPNKTAADKTKGNIAAEPKLPVRNIFGNRPANKRKNMFADFIVSESEDEISEIQPKVFGFQKNVEQRRFSSTSKGRESSPTSSMNTDIELDDDWKHLPSSTMVENQLDEMVAGHTPVKRARLSKLTEVKESAMDTATSRSASSKSKPSPTAKNTTLASNKTVDKTKQSNTSITSKNKTRTSPRNKDITKSDEQEKTRKSIMTPSKEDPIIQENDDDENNFTLEYENDDEIEQENHDNNAQTKSQANILSNKTTIVSNDKSKAENKDKVTISPNKTAGNRSLRSNTLNKSHNDDNNKSLNRSRLNKSLKSDDSAPDKRAVNTSQSNISSNKTNRSVNKSNNSLNKSQKSTNRNNKSPNKSNESLNKSNLNNSLQQKTQPPKATKTIVESQDSKQHTADDNIDGVSQNKETGISHHSKIEANEEQEIEVEAENSHEREAESHLEQDEPIESQVEEPEDIEENEQADESEDKHVSEVEEEETQENNEVHGEQDEESREVTAEQSEEVNEDHSQDMEEDNTSKHDVIDQIQQENKENNTSQKVNIETKENKEEKINKSQVKTTLIEEVKSDQKQAAKNSERQIGIRKDDSQQQVIQSKEGNDELNQSHEEEGGDEVNQNQETEDDQEGSESKVAEEDDEVNQSQEVVDDQDGNESEGVEEDDDVEVDQSQEIEDDVEVDQSQEVVDDVEVDQSQEVEDDDEADLRQEVEDDAEIDQSQEVEDDDEANESQEAEDDEVNQSQEVEDEAEQSEDEEENIENQTVEQTNNTSQEQESEEEADASQEIENEEDESKENQEVEDGNQSGEDQEIDDSADADRAIATDEISEDDQEEMEVDDDQNDNEVEADDDETEEAIKSSPNVTHDTTGRHRKKVKSPEVILHDKTNRQDSFLPKGRNTSFRKTRSLSKDIHIRPSLAPARDSLGLSDGTRDSSAEGSGWDSHRTTRKTLRQTFGKDFTPRKSLRALVMEKSAKQAQHIETLHSETVKFPQANSTEYPDDTNRVENVTIESDHDVSRRTRQTTLETYLQKIKQQNIEKKMKMEEAIRNSLKAPATPDTLSLFKVPARPPPRKLKPASTKPKKQIKSILFGELPSEVVEDMKYKPPKRYQPANASWITKRLYKYLENKLEPKYDYKARIRAEKLVETIYQFARELRRHHVAPSAAVDVLKLELARLHVVKTHFDFYEFFHEFMPREVRVKVVPDIVNKIPLPRHGVFADILRGNTVQG